MKATGFLMIAASAALLSGCGATVPIELTGARQAYTRASEGPAAQSAPVELHAAQAALAAAETSYKDDSDSYRARDLAYVAQRKAEMAEAQASINTEQASSSKSRSVFRQEQGALLQERTKDLDEARTQLAVSEEARQGSAEQLVVEQEARLDAEKRLTERDNQAPVPVAAESPEREAAREYGQSTDATVDQRVAEQIARRDAERRSADQDRLITDNSRELNETRTQLAVSEQARVDTERRLAERNNQAPAPIPTENRDREAELVRGQSSDASVDQRVAEQLARHDAERKSADQDRQIMENSRQLNETRTALAASETRDDERERQLREQSDDLTKARADLAASEKAGQASSAELAAAQTARLSAEKATTEAQDELAKLVASKVTPRGEVFTLSGGVIFRSNESVLMPGAERQLDQLVKALASTPDRMVLVEGYTDSKGSAEHNLDLSQRRADAVRSYLMRNGYSADQVQARGIGESSPIADNDTSEGRANNRRVEIVLVNAQKQ